MEEQTEGKKRSKTFIPWYVIIGVGAAIFAPVIGAFAAVFPAAKKEWNFVAVILLIALGSFLVRTAVLEESAPRRSQPVYYEYAEPAPEYWEEEEYWEAAR